MCSDSTYDPLTESAQTGRRGEQIATEYLRRNGFLIRERNWRNGRYEVDIIAEKWDTIRFVEVKTRRAGSLTPPEAALTASKFRALRRAASYYLALHRIVLEPQFDLCAVEMQPDGTARVRYVEHAMESDW